MEDERLFGFGLMRLPLKDENNQKSIDQDLLNEMVDYYIQQGFNYFDTSYAYHEEKSEEAFRKAVVERYPRESYHIADKIPTWLLQKEEDNEKFFNIMLERNGVDYLDYLLIHNINENWKKLAEKTKSFEFLQKMKKEGKVRFVGFSFHDTPELLEKVLEKHHEDVDFVQLELNYLDWEDPQLQAKKCHEIAQNYNLPIIVMEPLKGGGLVNLSSEVTEELEKINPNASQASWALRFAASQDNVFMVLSGMNSMEQLKDNCNTFKNFKKLSQEEETALTKTVDKIRKNMAVPCSYCNYCVEHCPEEIPIPTYFNLLNNRKQTSGEMTDFYYTIKSGESTPASECIECGECIDYCTQKINIPEMLKLVVETFEK